MILLDITALEIRQAIAKRNFNLSAGNINGKKER